jgi:hypothetical protein
VLYGDALHTAYKSLRFASGIAPKIALILLRSLALTASLDAERVPALRVKRGRLCPSFALLIGRFSRFIKRLYRRRRPCDKRNAVQSKKRLISR